MNLVTVIIQTSFDKEELQIYHPNLDSANEVLNIVCHHLMKKIASMPEEPAILYTSRLAELTLLSNVLSIFSSGLSSRSRNSLVYLKEIKLQVPTSMLTAIAGPEILVKPQTYKMKPEPIRDCYDHDVDDEESEEEYSRVPGKKLKPCTYDGTRSCIKIDVTLDCNITPYILSAEVQR